MKRLTPMFLVLALAGCMTQTRPESPSATNADGKKAEEKLAASLPLIQPGKANEMNATRIAQDLDDEMKREAKIPPKVVVEARK